MLCVNRLGVILLLLWVKNSRVLASFAPSIPDYMVECLQELGIRYGYGGESSELANNRTCLTKCHYEKQGKLSLDGQLIISKFPNGSSDAVAECLDLVKITDICKKTSMIESCVTHKTDPYWQKYNDCEKYMNYNDDSGDNTNYCYTHCQLIKDGNLDENGKVNFSALTVFEHNPNNTITHETALEICNNLVTDNDQCIRDINIYYCITYMLYHWSSKVLETEMQCAKTNNIYPFFGVNNADASRTCYDRCIMITNGDLNENDLMKSESFKKLNMSESKIEEAFNTCKMTIKETDKCTKDLYFYDCVTYLNYADPLYLKKQKECAQETNSPLVSYRQKYNENHCNTRCLMMKDNQLHSNGAINRTNLKQFSINDTIIDESIDYCSKQNKDETCMGDVNAYYCATSMINEKVYKLCEQESKKYKKAPEVSYYNLCSSRCLMTHAGQLDLNGDVMIDSFKYSGLNVTTIEKAIKTCKIKTVDEDECTKAVNNYNCVSSEIWNINMEHDNSVYAANVVNSDV